jgi:hypothetical protein
MQPNISPCRASGATGGFGSKQREQFWPVFASARASLESRGFYTWPGVFIMVTGHFAGKPAKPFSQCRH